MFHHVTRLNLHFLPISALLGDNVVDQSQNMTWDKGQTLLKALENVKIEPNSDDFAVRFPVQFIIRPHSTQFHDYRGYAGKIASGSFSVGEEVTVLPTGQTSKIATIEKFSTQLQAAGAKESVVITLETDVDVSRGNMLVKAHNQPEQLKEITARICWMDSQSLVAGKNYILQHGINDSKAKIISLNNKINDTTISEDVDYDGNKLKACIKSTFYIESGNSKKDIGKHQVFGNKFLNVKYLQIKFS